MTKTLIIACLVALAVTTFGVGQAQADPIVVYNFTSDHCTGTCGTPPFGTVTLEQILLDVKVTVSVDGPGESALAFVTTGPGVANEQNFLFNAVDVVLGDIVVAPHSPYLLATAGAYGKAALGTFAFGISCPDCGNGADGGFSSDIVFTVTGATIADLTHANAVGNVFIADVLGANNRTGAVDATTARVPDGGMTLTLLGGALVGLGALRRKFGA